MKKLTVFLVAAGMVFGASGMAMAADANATADISATVLAPIAISKTTDLNFGSFAADADVAGTVVITTAGERSFTGDTVAISTDAGGFTAAAFDVTGENLATYSITLPAAVDISDGTNIMSVGTFISDPATGGELSASGAQTVNVGATLTVAAAQPSGAYTSTDGLSITVAYN